MSDNIDIGNGLQLTEIRIWPTRDAHVSRVKAMATLTFNDTLRVNQCRIIEGAKGFFLSYPSQQKLGSNDWIPLCFPVNRSVSDAIQTAVIAAYTTALEMHA